MTDAQSGIRQKNSEMGKGICHAQRQYQIPTGFIAFGLEPALRRAGCLDVEGYQ
jgi:hypothetical protein